jgi:multisubunit Na+/H+ antiporter MnhE subunit
MTFRSQLHPANVYDSDLHEPLLVQPRPSQADLRSFNSCTLGLGLMVGFVIQMSTLGANFLVMSMLGESLTAKPHYYITMFSTFWSIVTSALSICVLLLLRRLLRLPLRTFQMQVMEDILHNLECKFVAGALVGVCLAWLVTDVVLGLTPQVVYSLATLGLALVWCNLSSRCVEAVGEDEEANGDEPLLVI